MRLATFIAPGEDRLRAGQVRGDEVVAWDDGTTVLDRLASGDRSPAGGPAYRLADVEMLAPVPRPRAIFGIGLNYADHAAETGRDAPEFPIVFLKLPSSSAAPNATLAIPDVVRRLDYEGELAVVMGAGGEVAGYAVADDVSARDLQGREPQWTRAKGFDNACPWGPWITTADEVPDPHALRLRTWVNGELRQDASTSVRACSCRAATSCGSRSSSWAPSSTGSPDQNPQETGASCVGASMTRTSRLLLAAVVAAGVLVPAGSAIAADRTGTLDSTTTSFAWDSKLGTGVTTLSNLHDKVPCGTPVVHDCDFTLLHVVGLGTIDVKETQGSPNAVDTDLYVYDSDADGTQGDLEGTSAQGSPTPNEEVVFDAISDDGYYLVETDYTDNLDAGGGVKGVATFTPAPTTP